jgi:2-dehydropantoate 2-reductase
MRMAVMGAGSLGTIVGALVTKGGYDIDLIDVNVDHVKALNAKGAKITGLMEELVRPVKAITPDEMTGEYDLIFYLTKTTQNESALKYVIRHLKRDGVVVCMQNGIPEDAVADAVGKDRTVGCIVGWGATWVEPGVSKLTSKTNNMHYVMGELDGKDTGRLHEIAKVLNSGYSGGDHQPDRYPLDEADGKYRLERHVSGGCRKLWRCAGQSQGAGLRRPHIPGSAGHLSGCRCHSRGAGQV